MKLSHVLLASTSGLLLQGCLLEDTNIPKEPEKSIPIPDVASLKAAAKYPIGAALPAGDSLNSVLDRSDLQQVVSKHFSQITAENIMKPIYVQPTKGSFFYTDADALEDYAASIGASIHGHALVWHQSVPEWMITECAKSAEDCEAVMSSHISNVVSHYAAGDTVVSWDVVNEAFNDDGSYRDQGEWGSFWYANIGESYISKAYIAAKQALTNQSPAKDAAVDLYYNDYAIEQDDAKLTAVLNMVDTVNTDGSNPLIEGIGFQMHVGLTQPAITDISSSFKKAAATGLKVKITELDVRINESGTLSQFTYDLAMSQKQRYQDIVAAYLETVPVAQRGGVSVWGVSDADSWIPSHYGSPDWPLLFDTDLQAKPALEGMYNAIGSEEEDPEEPTLFSDKFDGEFKWGTTYQTIVGPHESLNASEQVMNIVVPWASTTDKYGTGVLMDVDFSTPRTIQFDIYVPSSIGTGDLAVQPLVQQSQAPYGGVYDIAYQFGYTLDEWSTITIENVQTDLENIDRLGFNFIANDVVLPANAVIKIDNVIVK
ncbi:endo-1,4-beta-xylanase [Vibrio hippocampi]|uniref:Beta-xylanase n=1 Tax=Vibrio hippocampi TaxID=654686 RepID=A0ABN8DIE7_9VIBR|nr:endo-1,4-beta-xylanase [Vibrio hippocampi]CAH0528837.1 hypothetical protein VHP8226_02864 [Vibrio hippocampi]